MRITYFVVSEGFLHEPKTINQTEAVNASVYNRIAIAFPASEPGIKDLGILWRKSFWHWAKRKVEGKENCLAMLSLK